MDIKKRIKQLTRERGWSDYRLAQEAGLSRGAISNMYKRTTDPAISTIEAICKALGITLAQFFSSDDAPVYLSSDQRVLLFRWDNISKAQKKIMNELFDQFELTKAK